MLSQGTGYAITAMGYVASAGGRAVLVKDIADAAEVPGPYLAKLIHVLAKKGLVTTQRGVGGGVALAKAATQISLHDVCVALDDPVIQTRCMLAEADCCDERGCPAHKFWAAEREKIQSFLKRTMVADIAAFEAMRRWKANGHRPPTEASDA